MSDTDKFQFAQWPVEVVRKPRRRHITIQITAHKPIKVLAAQGTSHKYIVDFLMTKKSWLEKHFKIISEVETRFPKKKFKGGELFPFLGKNLTFKVVITFQKKAFVSFTDEFLLFHIPRDQWSAESVWQEYPYAGELIRQTYMREAKKVLAEKTKYWSEQMKLIPSGLKFREARTRWGSCNSKRRIILNWRLIVFAPEVVDYVVIHELSHLAHFNHSENFWSLVESYQPFYKNSVKVLREEYRQVQFLDKEAL